VTEKENKEIMNY